MAQQKNLCSPNFFLKKVMYWVRKEVQDLVEDFSITLFSNLSNVLVSSFSSRKM